MDALGGTSGGQYASVSGPSLAASAQANMAQQAAIQNATQIAGQSELQGIQALMGNYQTSMALNMPTTAAGYGAQAQENYMLGLNPYNPGAAPTGPGAAPTAASLSSTITPEQIQAYIQQNTTFNGIAAGPGQQQALIYSGVGSAPVNGTPQGMVAGSPIQGIDQLGAHGYSLQDFTGNSGINSAVTNYLAQQALPAATASYDTANTAYQAQQQLYNTQEGLYNQYSAQGPATSADINNVVTNQPGFQANLTQGVNAIQNAGSASGMLNSGNILEQLNQFGQGMASNYYNQYMGNLQNVSNAGQQATNNATASTNNAGTGAAGLAGQYGTNAANAQLSAGQASASSYLNPAANQQVMGSYLGGGSSNAMGLLGAGIGALGNFL